MAKYDFYIENLVEQGFDEKILEKYIPEIFDKLLKEERIKAEFAHEFKILSFDIVLCDDEYIHKINKDYRKKDSPTDVITFALFADDEQKLAIDGEIALGEIIISLETAKKQAQEAEHSLLKELLTLITHGALHLFGFDHKSNVDYTFVVSTQEKVLKTLGGI